MKNMICSACAMTLMLTLLLDTCSAMEKAVEPQDTAGKTPTVPSAEKVVEPQNVVKNTSSSYSSWTDQKHNNEAAMDAIEKRELIENGLFLIRFNKADDATKEKILPIASSREDSCPSFGIVYTSGIKFKKSTLIESINYAALFCRYGHVTQLLESLKNTSDAESYSSTVNKAFVIAAVDGINNRYAEVYDEALAQNRGRSRWRHDHHETLPKLAEIKNDRDETLKALIQTTEVKKSTVVEVLTALIRSQSTNIYFRTTIDFLTGIAKQTESEGSTPADATKK